MSTIRDIVEFIPFCKTFGVSATSSVVVTLTDTLGSAIDCDYIRVAACVSISNNSYFTVVPSGLSQNSIAFGNAASGSLGYAGSVLQPVEIKLPSAKKTRALTINYTYSGAGTQVIAVTYGVIKNSNPLKNHGVYGGV